MQRVIIRINPEDNVAVALRDLNVGEELLIEGETLSVFNAISVGNKIALADIAEGDNIIKYGFPIGRAVKNIRKGERIDHTNLQTLLSGIEDYSRIKIKKRSDTCMSARPASTFRGYDRPDGQAGIRNELWVIPTVGCVNGVAQKIVEHFKSLGNIEGIDGVYAFSHPFGCSQLGEDHENTKKILRGMVCHPNAGGVLIVGLGCENNQPHEFLKYCGNYNRDRVSLMVCQEVEDDEVEAGVELLNALYLKAKSDRRTAIPLSRLRIGLKCGGSDGFSGITANPLLGAFTDYLCDLEGGTAVMTEVPEMFGAETILMNRCADNEVLDKTIKMVNDFKQYYINHGQPVGENPSPGNKTGGISTLEEKSLGCIQKGGKSIVTDVLEYGDRISRRGFNLLSAPGNDLVASTALAAAGCQMVLFTTGRGTPFNTFVPTVKISTNTTLTEKKTHWIDFNAGNIVDGEEMEAALERFITAVKDVAEGRPTSGEERFTHEIAIFKTGVTL